MLGSPKIADFEVRVVGPYLMALPPPTLGTIRLQVLSLNTMTLLYW